LRKRAFSLVEVLIAIALLSAIAMYSYKNYINLDSVDTVLKSTKIKSDITLITSIIIKCNDISNNFPKNSDNSDANGSLLRTLECKSTTPYSIDGDKGGFIPKLPSGISDWSATESSGEFYIETSADKNSHLADVLKELSKSYPSSQVSLNTISSPTKDIFRFYIYK
jgi:prepilin-type N-terminal cleavage/methylation domain-containing protein